MTPEMAEGLRLAVVGVGTVFVALIVTGILVTIVGRLTKEKTAVPASAQASLPEETFSGGIDKHKVVLLAAAASVALKRPVRIRRVRFVTHKHIPTSWAAAGRADHMQESLD